tara:strand:+ start:14640 stop:15491 length:852 start_codon:yes stop_codon:yes gene_type:complete
MRIGIIGQGYVGTAVRTIFEKYYKVNTFDLNGKCSCQTLKDLVDSSDVIFVCVPTPMNNNGSCNTEIVSDVINDIDGIVNDNEKGKIVAIKSTVPPGTTRNFNQKYKKISVIFNPEFLTEANFIDDFKNQNRIILGGEREATTTLRQVYSLVFPDATIVKTASTTAEMVKYFTNTFLATKVSFANEMKIICDNLDIDYDKVVEYAIYDDRLGKSHWAVPGPDGKLGFGGSCFPKDINALAHICKKLDIPANVLLSAINTNLMVRPEKDWEELKGRAVVEDEKK